MSGQNYFSLLKNSKYSRNWILHVNTLTKVHKNLWFVWQDGVVVGAKIQWKTNQSFSTISESVREHLFGNGKWVTDKCQSESDFIWFHPTVNFAEKLHLVHPLEKKQISLISYAKSDFSVNKNLKREEEASDTDGAAIRTSHTDPKANYLSKNCS